MAVRRRLTKRANTESTMTNSTNGGCRFYASGQAIHLCVCTFCSYRNRCGQADTPYKDYRPVGLLPVFTGYREEQLAEYLDAYEAAGAKLTPTLANEFPELASEYGSYDWCCSVCGSSFTWTAVDVDDSDGQPVCPGCIEHGEFVTLSGPEPEDQLAQVDLRERK